jgi:hypothetical protein
MPLTLNVGLSKKVGLPDYGSLGVACNVEVELDATLLLHDLEGFQQKVRQAYLACHQAVQDELSRQQHVASTNSNGHPPTNGNGQPTNGGRTNGQPRDQTRRATASQVRAIEAISRRQQMDLANLLRQRFGTDKTADLSITEASSLIDELKTAANGSGGGR